MCCESDTAKSSLTDLLRNWGLNEETGNIVYEKWSQKESRIRNQIQKELSSKMQVIYLMHNYLNE